MSGHTLYPPFDLGLTAFIWLGVSLFGFNADHVPPEHPPGPGRSPPCALQRPCRCVGSRQQHRADCEGGARLSGIRCGWHCWYQHSIKCTCQAWLYELTCECLRCRQNVRQGSSSEYTKGCGMLEILHVVSLVSLEVAHDMISVEDCRACRLQLQCSRCSTHMINE
jgi:hypothetical protein